MSKKNKKKHHRSKASKMRRHIHQKYPHLKGEVRSENGPEFLGYFTSESDDGPNIGESVAVLDASDLGRNGEPGAIAWSMARFLTDLKSEVAGGRKVGSNLFFQWCSSNRPQREWIDDMQIHGAASFSVPTIPLLFLDAEHTSRYCMLCEERIRDQIARINEHEEEPVQSLLFHVEDTDEDKGTDQVFDGVFEGKLDDAPHLALQY